MSRLTSGTTWPRRSPAPRLAISLRACPSTDATGQSCGGFRIDGPRECPDGFFCAYDEAYFCGRADAPGTCQRRPELCPAIHDPVCGCDGQTYSNACAANAAGVSVDSSGPCAG